MNRRRASLRTSETGDGRALILDARFFYSALVVSLAMSVPVAWFAF